MMRIQVNPKLIEWALERSGLSRSDLEHRFPKIEEWGRGELGPTMRQLENLAKATRTALGHFFLDEPPEDKLPIPDLRTVRSETPIRPSPDLLETIEMMQRRQAWMRDFLIEEGQPPLPFVDSVSLDAEPASVASGMRETLELAEDWARRERTWESALRRLRASMEVAGILVAVNGIVGLNTHRALRVEEFRGFALVDEYAPLVFVNNRDVKAAQMFTLAHEMAHVWIGTEGVSNLDALEPPEIRAERFCNAVAAEFLVPCKELDDCWPEARQSEEPFDFVAKRFKVSALVAARRGLDLGLISRDAFLAFYRDYREAAEERREKASKARDGGDFWNTAYARIGRYFSSAVVQAVKEGRLSYRDAYRLTGLRGATFDTFVAELEF